VFDVALKFLYLTEDPFVNTSEEFVRILSMQNFPTITSGGGGQASGTLVDPSGNSVGILEFATGTVATEATAYPYGFSAGWSASQIIIVPPGWSFKSFIRAVAVQGSLEEVLRVY
jgi:hypothetical protein